MNVRHRCRGSFAGISNNIQVTFEGHIYCTLNEIMSGESVALKVIKLNPDINFYMGKAIFKLQ